MQGGDAGTSQRGHGGAPSLRLHAQNYLAVTEENLGAILEGISDGFLVIDRQWRLTFMNSSAMALLGPFQVAPEITIGKVLWDIFPALEGSAFEPVYRRAMDEGVSGRVSACYTPYGRYFEATAYPHAEGIAISFRDVTDEKNAEAALQAAHDTFQYLVKQSPFGVYVVDADFRLIQVSAGAQKVFEKVRPLIGRDFAEVLRCIWPEPFASEAIGHFRHTLETGETYHAPRTVEQRRDTESVEAYDWKIERLLLPDGRHGVVCHFYDLSERQQHEAELAESERRFRDLADSMPQLVWIADQDGNVFYYNARVGEYEGFALAPGGYWTWQPVLHEEDRDKTEQAWTTAVETGTMYQCEHRVRMAGGGFRWHLSRGLPIASADGKLTWYGTATDVHELKETQQELLAVKCELDLRVRERTLELEEKTEQLVQRSNELTLAEQREKARLAGILHDELQQLLVAANWRIHAIKSKAEALVASEVEDLQELMEHCLRATRDVSAELRPGYLYTDSVAASLDWIKRWKLRKHGLNVDLRLEEDFIIPQEEVRVLAFNCVREALFNVVKHANVKDAVVRVAPCDGASVQFFVEDTGDGFDMAALEARARESASQGLLNMKTRLEDSGGKLSITSTPGKGTCVTIRVPLSPETP